MTLDTFSVGALGAWDRENAQALKSLGGSKTNMKRFANNSVVCVRSEVGPQLGAHSHCRTPQRRRSAGEQSSARNAGRLGTPQKARYWAAGPEYRAGRERRSGSSGGRESGATLERALVNVNEARESSSRVVE